MVLSNAYGPTRNEANGLKKCMSICTCQVEYIYLPANSMSTNVCDKAYIRTKYYFIYLIICFKYSSQMQK